MYPFQVLLRLFNIIAMLTLHRRPLLLTLLYFNIKGISFALLYRDGRVGEAGTDGVRGSSLLLRDSLSFQALPYAHLKHFLHTLAFLTHPKHFLQPKQPLTYHSNLSNPWLPWKDMA